MATQTSIQSCPPANIERLAGGFVYSRLLLIYDDWLCVHLAEKLNMLKQLVQLFGKSFGINDMDEDKPLRPITEHISFTDQFLTRASVFLSCRSVTNF